MTRITALIADDVAEMRQLLRATLREFDCEVVCETYDGTNVLTLVQKEKPEIVFLDLDMPKMSGLDVLAELAALKNPPYTVIITADTSFESRSKALDHGASGFINKPYTAQKIGDVIKSYRARPNAAMSCTALVADDEALMRDLLKSALEKQNCHVKYAVEDGSMVLDCLTQNPPPDLVFLDIEMPVMDGLSTLKKIRAQKMNVFCVMVSAHSTFENVKNAMDQGADGFLVKPYSEDKIRQVLGKFHARKKAAAS